MTALKTFSTELCNLIDSEPKLAYPHQEFERLKGLSKEQIEAFNRLSSDKARFEWLVSRRFYELVNDGDPDLICTAKQFRKNPTRMKVYTADGREHTVTTQSHRKALKNNFHLLSDCKVVKGDTK